MPSERSKNSCPITIFLAFLGGIIALTSLFYLLSIFINETDLAAELTPPPTATQSLKQYLQTTYNEPPENYNISKEIDLPKNKYFRVACKKNTPCNLKNILFIKVELKKLSNTWKIADVETLHE